MSKQIVGNFSMQLIFILFSRDWIPFQYIPLQPVQLANQATKPQHFKPPTPSLWQLLLAVCCRSSVKSNSGKDFSMLKSKTGLFSTSCIRIAWSQHTSTFAAALANLTLRNLQHHAMQNSMLTSLSREGHESCTSRKEKWKRCHLKLKQEVLSLKEKTYLFKLMLVKTLIWSLQWVSSLLGPFVSLPPQLCPRVCLVSLSPWLYAFLVLSR